MLEIRVNFPTLNNGSNFLRFHDVEITLPYLIQTQLYTIHLKENTHIT